MQPFKRVDGVVAPLDRANVDTDAIIPKQFLKSIKRSGFGPNLFDEWRYLDRGEPGQDCSIRPLNPEFILNQERYRGPEILIARANFGCGSSREHAPWALADFGFKVVIAPSFADIFFNNSFKNGLLSIQLPSSRVDELFAEIFAAEGYRLDVDLESQTITKPDGNSIAFDIDPFRKHCLGHGLDEIDLTLQHRYAIDDFEARYRQSAPWLFDNPI